jgi:hypothetical protein
VPATITPAITATLAIMPSITPAATRPMRPTATPRPEIKFELRVFEDIRFDTRQLNSLAVDAAGRMYVPDAAFSVIVFSPRFIELRRIPVLQAVAVGFNLTRDQLYVGRQYPATIERYNLAGKRLGVLWSEQNVSLDCFAVDTQNAIYVVYTAINKPYTRFLLRLDPNGNILLLRVLNEETLPDDRAYGIAFERDGTLNLAVSGYGGDPARLALWQFTPDGDRLLNRQRPYLVDRPLLAPGNPLRLADDTLVIYAGEGLGWWGADGRQIGFRYWTDTADGNAPRLEGRSSGIALGVDGKTIYYADLIHDGRLVLGRTRLQ